MASIIFGFLTRTIIDLRCFSFHEKRHSTISRPRMLPSVSNLNKSLLPNIFCKLWEAVMMKTGNGKLGIAIMMWMMRER